MRAIMLPVIFILLQALTYGLYLALSWFLRPMGIAPSRALLIGVFVVSNALILSMFAGLFRVGVGWLSLLWLGFLSAILAAILLFLLQKAGMNNAWAARGVAMVCFFGVAGFAVFNAYSPTVRYLTLNIDKKMPVPVRVAMVSDLHLGVLFGNAGLDKLRAILTAQNVDILLIPGDIMDDNTTAYEKYAMAAHLKNALAAAPVATVATLGNHDLYQSQAYDAITDAVHKAGAVLLIDESTTLAVHKNGATTQLAVIGRLDDHAENRAKTADLLAQTDPKLPTIVLDHRPSEIEQNSQLPIDLQVSGHTHNGQVFPANLIVQAINRLGYGYEQINGTHFVVSSGYGFWGIPLRIGSRSEVWVVDLVGN